MFRTIMVLKRSHPEGENGNVLLLSSLYRVENVNSKIEVISSKIDFSLFSQFYLSFTKKTPVRLSARNNEYVLTRFLFVYIAMWLFLDSTVIRLFSQLRTRLVVDESIFSFIRVVAPFSRSENKLSGVTEGLVSSGKNDLIGAVAELLDNDVDKFRTILSGTPFGVLIDDTFVRKLKREIRLTESLFCDGSFGGFSTLPHELNKKLSFIKSSFACLPGIVSYPDRYQVHDGIVEFDNSTVLGVYRFVNGIDDEQYLCSQQSVNSLGAVSMNTYACFLFLCKPTIYVNSYHTSYRSIPGGIPITFRNVSAGEVFDFIFGLAGTPSFSGKQKEKKDRKDSAGKDSKSTGAPLGVQNSLSESSPNGNIREFSTMGVPLQIGIANYLINGKHVCVPYYQNNDSGVLYELLSLDD